jgi:hypothetical protein
VFLEESAPESYQRHFFLPSDWLSTDDTLLAAFTASNEIVFAREHELAVIKRGLDSSQTVAISVPPSRRASVGT